MIDIAIKSGRGFCRGQLPQENYLGTFHSALPPAGDAAALVRSALQNFTGEKSLAQLAAEARNAVIICSDHTRPVPSFAIIPEMLRELRSGNPGLEITLLIATGCHRDPTEEELREKFGDAIVKAEKIVIHHAWDENELISVGKLPSGGELKLNCLAMSTDLLLAEGFIEPHFFAGFSGGRKSVLPGIAGKVTVLANHCAEFIAHPCARTGILNGNPIHEDMLYAGIQAKLRFIVNAVINQEKETVAVFAGDMQSAHAAGCSFLQKYAQVEIPESDIVITGNGGFPLDQNVYQCVKSMSTAEAVVRPGGVIIVCAECADGHGGESFFQHLRDYAPAELLEEILSIPRNATIPDQWQYQIMARILLHAKVIVVSKPENLELLRSMRFTACETLDEAIKIAFAGCGKSAKVSVIPDGVAVIPVKK